MSVDRRVHFLTLYLAGIIVLVFAGQQLLGWDLAWTVGQVEYQFFTSWVAHGSMQHLLGNLFALLVFGLILEGVLGTKRYAIVLLSAALLGNLAGIGSYTRVLGISGAIYGIFGALAVLRPRMIVWVSALPMPMLVAAIAWSFVDVMGLFSNTNTGHLAHLAGIVAGIILGFVWRKQYAETKKGGRRKLQPDEKQQIDAALDNYEQRYMR